MQTARPPGTAGNGEAEVPEESSGLTERLRVACRNVGCAEVARLTNVSQESVRRYVTVGRMPSVAFVAALCDRLEISADWLLTGRDEMQREDARRRVLREASTRDLLDALADQLDRIASGQAPPETEAAIPGHGNGEFVHSSLSRGLAEQPVRDNGEASHFPDQETLRDISNSLRLNGRH